PEAPSLGLSEIPGRVPAPRGRGNEHPPPLTRPRRVVEAFGSINRIAPVSGRFLAQEVVPDEYGCALHSHGPVRSRFADALPLDPAQDRAARPHLLPLPAVPRPA